MKSIRRNIISPALAHAKSHTAPSVYLFCEKTTGAAHFRVEAGPDGELPLDHAAGLLAMQCMVRELCPSDYLIMVPAAPENFCDLTEKAQKLLEAGHNVKANVRLTRREEEVLDGILRSLANKEIACELNISERTVKFHISSLLSKFKVRNRMELIREASQQAMKPRPAAVGFPATMIRGLAPESEVSRRIGNSGEILCLERPRLMA